MPSRALKENASIFRLVVGERSSKVPTSDEEIIDAVQRGEHRVARLLYERLFGVVDATLYRVFGRREADHEDMIQAVFEQIVLTLSRRSYAKACSLKTWAASIATHVAFTHLRSRRRERKVVARELEVDTAELPLRTDSEGQACASLELERVRRHLLAMTPKLAHTVFLHDVLGHPLAEVALITSVSAAAATSRLVRGRRTLYERLDADSASERASGAG
jgi:RNA polymerase sigma-70 factor (ECF subfamily)